MTNTPATNAKPPALFPAVFSSLVLLLSACASTGEAGTGENLAQTLTPETPLDQPDDNAQSAEASLPPPAADILYARIPEDVLTRVILAEMAGQRGYNRQALDEYLSLARETGDLNIIKRASRIAAYLRDVPASIEMADMWVAREADSQEAHQTLAFQMLALSRYGEALRHLEALLAMGEEVDFRLLSNRLIADDNAPLFLDTLAADFRALRREHPDNLSLTLALAQLYQQDGELERARSLLSDLSAEQRDDEQVVMLEVGLLSALGETEAARRRLEQSLRAHPDNSRLRFLYARQLIGEQRYEDAHEQFELLVARSPDDFDMLYSLALLNMELERFDAARENFNRLATDSRRRNDAHFFLAALALHEEDRAGAIDYLRQVRGGPNFLEAQHQLTELLVSDGRYREARDHLQRLRRSRGEFNQPLLGIEASVLLDQGMHDEAESLLSNALTAFPDNTQLLYLRSVLYQETGDLAPMERDLRRIIELEPDSAMAYNSLGYILADRTDRHQEAYELILRAIELAPNDPAIIDSLGWVQYRLGLYEEALENLDRAYELYPDHEVAAHLGEVLWVLGEKEKAHRIWREGLEERPDSEYIHDAIQRLTTQSSL